MKISAFLPPAFIKLLTFRILIVLSYQMVAVIVGWHIYELIWMTGRGAAISP